MSEPLSKVKVLLDGNIPVPSDKMAEPLSKVKVILDGDEFVVLDHNSRRYMNVKISSPEEIIEHGIRRNYKSPLKNSYMVFRKDIIDSWNIAKETKKYRKYPDSFKDISLIWNSLPKNVTDIYEQIYSDYKKLIPKFEEFVPYSVQEENMGENIGEGGAEDKVNDSEYLLPQLEVFQHTPSDNVNLVISVIDPVKDNENASNFGAPQEENAGENIGEGGALIPQSEIFQHDNDHLASSVINYLEGYGYLPSDFINPIETYNSFTSPSNMLDNLNDEIETEMFLTYLMNGEFPPYFQN